MILYSTNCYLKYFIQKEFYKDVHYIWCSEIFDSKTLSTYSAGHFLPPSSNPADIYKQLQGECVRPDRHSYKINEQRASFKSLAMRFAASGTISDFDRDEIISLADSNEQAYWRPLIYLIPQEAVMGRVKLVPIAKRASIAKEYIIEDLKGSEFQIIEL
ncbi:hypothetical protein GCM10028806_28090 [Spirosoma terrae]|uniref:Uncharacterized protein n=1 Tax=Spirosoma terrae TaxID=1968276 RepID=A0A6L9LFE7_9BACT|nr:hypothetical protein [Spirosoma terrae]NDU97228.1 hypothetical protein [Spirosoma terrae]